MRCIVLSSYLATAILILFPGPAEAYIGPGAGFALVSSFFILILAFLLALFTIFTLPVRSAYLFIKRRKIKKNMQARRVIVIGFDGMDPDLCDEYMAEGKLPNLSKLAQTGSYSTLKTTTPAISPVAWSTFSTGVNPGKHRIFDFFTRDPRNYLPVLSSVKVESGKRNKTKCFPFFYKSNNTYKLLRKSKTFWKILGESKIFSTILRVPITFPPEKSYGVCLSAMCTPDLRGTQGSFTYFTSDKSKKSDLTQGTVINIQIKGNHFSSHIPGPTDPSSGNSLPLSTLLTGYIDHKKQALTVTVCDETFTLHLNQYSPWVKLNFKVGVKRKIHGIARFLVRELSPHIRLYMTPINIDPEHPSMPITHPSYYATCLAKLHGPFATLGLSEDTWALNNNIIDEQAFLTQAYDICSEREAVFLDSLNKTKDGLIVSVFDTTDRIQHMFFRYLVDGHPANAGKDITLHKNAIAEVYERSDQLIGKVLDTLTDDDLLLVLSDHGFKPFQWGINLNSWLWQEGYLVLNKDASPGAEWLADVDWNKTRAYALGLAGIFINTKGREKSGFVKPGPEKHMLLVEIKEKLEKLYDKEQKQHPVNRIILAKETLKGPYISEAPDLFPGFISGYRVSWNSATGRITENIFEPNTKHWSGDHCLDPELVPGVLFSNWHLDEPSPALIDMAPTILNIFGLQKEKFHDGKVLKLKKNRQNEQTAIH